MQISTALKVFWNLGSHTCSGDKLQGNDDTSLKRSSPFFFLFNEIGKVELDLIAQTDMIY